MQCRSASAHQLTINKPGKFDDAFKSKFPRTYSAAAVGCSKENLSSDGFDISQLEHDIIEEGVRSAGMITSNFLSVTDRIDIGKDFENNKLLL